MEADAEGPPLEDTYVTAVMKREHDVTSIAPSGRITHAVRRRALATIRSVPSTTPTSHAPAARAIVACARSKKLASVGEVE